MGHPLMRFVVPQSVGVGEVRATTDRSEDGGGVATEVCSGLVAQGGGTPIGTGCGPQ
jgi:hypothetical protein